MMHGFVLSVLATVAAGGLLKQLFLSRYTYAGMYFNAIASTVLLLMVVSVILAVFRGRPLLAPSFTLMSSTLIIVLFYSREALSFATLVLPGLGVVAFTTWMLAYLGCMLRQRLRNMG